MTELLPRASLKAMKALIPLSFSFKGDFRSDNSFADFLSNILSRIFFRIFFQGFFFEYSFKDFFSRIFFCGFSWKQWKPLFFSLKGDFCSNILRGFSFENSFADFLSIILSRIMRHLFKSFSKAQILFQEQRAND